MVSKQILNSFEIEERIEQKLPEHLKEKYRLIRRTKPEDINQEDRLEQTAKRITHWEDLSNKILANLIKELTEDNITTNNRMSYNTSIAQEIANAMSSAMTLLIEQQKANDPNNNDFFNKPKVYNGERDAQVIDLWIKSIEDYSEYKNYDNLKKYTLAKTLLDTDAKTWLYIVCDNPE